MHLVFLLLVLAVIVVVIPGEPQCETRRIDYFLTAKVCTNITDRFPSTIVFDASLICVQCNLPVLDDSTFASNYTQEMLNLTNANVRTVTPYAFSKIGSDLHRLILRNNQITSLPREILRKFTTLDEIDLRGNQLQDISGLLENMLSTGIDLSANRIKSITGAFKDISVVKLNLSYNLIDSIEEFTFNRTKFWEGRERKSWNQELSLHNNLLKVLSASVFRFAPESVITGSLFLQNNLLEIIENETFAELNKLSNLDLSGNRISVLYANSFKGLVNLNIIKLSSNLLTKLPFGIFKDMQRVSKLLLDNNLLEELQDSVFSGLVQLTHLNISQNRLRTISTSALLPLGHLESLDISNNRLHQLPHQMLMENHNQLRFVGLTDNFWICRDLVEMYKMLTRRSPQFQGVGKHYDVPNLHGIACSREELDSYENMDMTMFLANIAGDHVFEDIYDVRINGDGASLQDILEANLKIYHMLLIVIVIACVFIFGRLCFVCIIRILQARNIDKFNIFYTPRQNNDQLL